METFLHLFNHIKHSPLTPYVSCLLIWLYYTKLSINLRLIITDEVMSKWNIMSSFLLGVFNRD